MVLDYLLISTGALVVPCSILKHVRCEKLNVLPKCDYLIFIKDILGPLCHQLELNLGERRHIEVPEQIILILMLYDLFLN